MSGSPREIGRCSTALKTQCAKSRPLTFSAWPPSTSTSTKARPVGSCPTILRAPARPLNECTENVQRSSSHENPFLSRCLHDPHRAQRQRCVLHATPTTSDHQAGK